MIGSKLFFQCIDSLCLPFVYWPNPDCHLNGRHVSFVYNYHTRLTNINLWHHLSIHCDTQLYHFRSNHGTSFHGNLCCCSTRIDHVNIYTVMWLQVEPEIFLYGGPIWVSWRTHYTQCGGSVNSQLSKIAWGI